MKRFVLLTSVLCLGSVSALAAEGGMYFDVQTGVSKAQDLKKSDFDLGVFAVSPLPAGVNSKLDDQGSIWAVGLGYRPWRYFAADLSYVDLGTIQYRVTVPSEPTYLYKKDVSASGPALTAMGILPLGRFVELKARTGLMFAKTSVKDYETYLSDVLAEATDTDSRNLFGGISVAFNITDSFAAYIGVQRFFKIGDDDLVGGESDVDVVTIGLSFSQ